MGQVVDSLITEYGLQDAGYTAGVQRIVRTTQQFGQNVASVIRRLAGLERGNGTASRSFRALASAAHTAGSALRTAGGHVASFTSFVSGGITKLGAFAAMIGAAGAAAGGSFLKAAIGQAAKIEGITGMLAGLGSGAKEAGKQMAWLQRFAQSSVSQFDDLAEAGVRLEANGLRMQRWLPTVARISGAFGGMKEQVMMVADSLGRLASGDTGEALENLRQLGITKPSLIKMGLKFDGNGQLLTPVVKALEAIEKIAKQKFSRIADTMSGTLNVRWSNLQDAWNSVLDKFGQHWLGFLGGLVDTGKNLLGFLSDSGWVDSLSEKFKGLFQGLQSGEPPRWIFMALAVMERIPQMIAGAGETAVRVGRWLEKGALAVYNFLGQKAYDMINLFNSGLTGIINSLFNHLKGFFITAGKVLMAVISRTPGAIADAWKATKGWATRDPAQAPKLIWKKETSIPKLFDKGIDGLTGGKWGQFKTEINGGADVLQRDYREWLKKQGKEKAPDEEFGMFNKSYIQAPEEGKEAKKAAKHLEKIERNTDPQSWLRKLAIGGGALSFGVTDAEVAGVRRAVSTPNLDRINGMAQAAADQRQARDVRISFDAQKARALEQAMRDLAADVLQQAVRQGALLGVGG